MSKKVFFLLFALSTILVAASATVTKATKDPATAVDSSAEKKSNTDRAQEEADAFEETDYSDYESLDTLDPEYLDDVENFDEDSLDEVDRYSSKKKPSRPGPRRRKEKKPSLRRRRRRRTTTKRSGTSKKPRNRKSRKRRGRLSNGRKRKRRSSGKGRKAGIQKKPRKKNPKYSTKGPTTTKRSSTTQPRTTQPSTKPTGYIGGQNDKYPSQCKCRRLPNRGGICYDMKKSKRVGRCKRRNCDRSYECVTGGGQNLKNCYRRYAFEEVRVMYSYKGMHKCKRVKFKMPKVFYSPYY